MKNFTILMLFMLLSSCSSVLVADEWPEKECAEYRGLIGGLVVAYVTSLVNVVEATRAGACRSTTRAIVATA